MDKAKMLETVKKLPFDTNKVVYKEHGIEVYIIRPSKLPKRFKGYDLKKNFQIWLREGDREFRPNHMRVFIDLNLRVRSKPGMKRELLTAFDNIFYGKDPENELKTLKNEEFEHFLNPIEVIGVLSHLFIIEQEYNYNKESKFSPPTLFYQGWVREVIDAHKEIDNLCMSVANGQPPAAKYVNLENKKSKNYVKKLDSLWYLTG